MKGNRQNSWWIAPAAACGIGLIVLIVTHQLYPSRQPYAILLLLALLGWSFIWAFVKRDVWWAVAPGIWALAGMVAVALSVLLPENNGWIDLLILGAGTFLIAAIPNRRIEVNIAHFLAIVVVVIGFLLSPLREVWKILFIVLSILLAVYFAWLDREDMKELFAS
jgi:hypothetical protein